MEELKQHEDIIHIKVKDNSFKEITNPDLENNINSRGISISQEILHHSELFSYVKLDLFLLIRIMLIVVGMTLIILNSFYGFFLPHGNVKCFEDSLLNSTKFLNDFFKNNILYRNILLIFASFCIDLSTIYISAHWAIYAKSWRFIVALGLFYSLRSAVQVNYFFNINF